MPEITDELIGSLQAQALQTGRTLEVADSKCKGLRVRANKGGTVTFYLLYRARAAKKPRRSLLGKHPDVKLKRARELAAIERGKALEGKDPHFEKVMRAQELAARVLSARQEAHALRSKLTVRALSEQFLAAKADKRWVGRYRQLLNFNLIDPKAAELRLGLADKLADELTGDDIDTVLNGVKKRGAHIQARRVFETIRAMVRFGIKKGVISGNPMTTVDVPKNAVPRKRVLNTLELRTVWRKLHEWEAAHRMGAEPAPPIPQAVVRVLILQILLGCRLGELTGMLRSDVSDDWHTLTIPPERSKNGKAHALPLPPLARAIVQAAFEASQHPSYVFPVHGRTGAPWMPLRADVVSSHVAGIQNEFGFKDQRGIAAPWRSHDLRRTAATYWSRTGATDIVVSTLLNHESETKSSITRRSYNHNEMALEKRMVLTRWQVTLHEIVEGLDPFAISPGDIAALERQIIGLRPKNAASGGASAAE